MIGMRNLILLLSCASFAVVAGCEPSAVEPTRPITKAKDPLPTAREVAKSEVPTKTESLPPIPRIEDPKPMLNNADPEEKEDTSVPAPTRPDTVKPLNKANTLFIENREGVRRLWILAEVVNRDVPLEVFMCRKMTKEHEAILAADLDARDIHFALLAIGANPGSPVKYVPKYTIATGEPMRVLVHYMKGEKPVTHPAQDWILDVTTKKPLATGWVFAGSRFLNDPDNAGATPYYAANNGEIISVSNFVDSMLDLPVESSADAPNLMYRAMTEKIPPRRSMVYVIIERGK